jgi:hypothetical protein
MKKNIRARMAAALLILAAIPVVATAQARFGFGLEFGTPPAGRYYGPPVEVYGVPAPYVYEMREAGVYDEDMPVIYYIYTHSNYSLRQIYSLRLRGATWDNLSNWCGVPLYGYRSGPPYGNAYGHYRQGYQRNWNGYGRGYDDDQGKHGRRKGHNGRGGRHGEHEDDD